MNNQSKFAIFATLFILCLVAILITLFLPFARIGSYGYAVSGLSLLRIDEVGEKVRSTFGDCPLPLYGGAVLSAAAVILLLRKIIAFLRACYDDAFEYDSALLGLWVIPVLLITVAQFADILQQILGHNASYSIIMIPFVPFLRLFLCIFAIWLSRVLGDLLSKPFNDTAEAND